MFTHKPYLAALLVTISMITVACGIAKNTNSEVATADLTPEELLYSTANEGEFEALGLAPNKKQTIAEKAKEKIKENKKVSINTQKRAENVSKALQKLREVRAKSSKGLLQAKAKCDSISEAVGILKSTNSPKRPFDGMRKQFRKALKAERDETLKVNGFVSCAKVKNAVASLPQAAPAPATLADEVVPAVGAPDEVVLAPSEI